MSIERPQHAERKEQAEPVLREAIVERGEKILRGLRLGAHLKTQAPEQTIRVVFDHEPEVRGYAPEALDVDALIGNPQFSVERRKTSVALKMEYYVIERVPTPQGRETVTVRPDAHGAYPNKEDLDAALRQNLFLNIARDWGAQGIEVEQAAVVAHAYRKKKTEWLHAAMESLCAVGLTPERAADISTMVMEGFIKAHRERMERL